MVVRDTVGEPKTSPQVVIDHICYTVSNFDDAQVVDALKAKGAVVSGRPGDRNIFDPFNYYVQIASAATENAFRR
jgi:hypothetical protein